MCNTLVETSSIEVNVSDVVLTPLTCASLINEIIKCLVYGKSQIPYPYAWLKSVVSRKRRREAEEERREIEEQSKMEENESNIETNESNSQANKQCKKRNFNFAVERHYREVFSAYKILEDIMTNLNKEFSNVNSTISEVVILFGTTLYSIKETFRIKVPKLAFGHVESNHLGIAYKNQHKILRQIFFSKDWMDAMEITLPLTNMFVLLKKTSSDSDGLFQLNPQYSFSNRSHHVSIIFNYDGRNDDLCCENMSVYGSDNQKNSSEILKQSSDSKFYWYEAKALFRGFKDCYVDKVSASELW